MIAKIKFPCEFCENDTLYPMAKTEDKSARCSVCGVENHTPSPEQIAAYEKATASILVEDKTTLKISAPSISAELWGNIAAANRTSEPFSILPTLQSVSEMLEILMVNRLKRARIEGGIEALTELEDSPDTLSQLRTRFTLELSALTEPLGLKEK